MTKKTRLKLSILVVLGMGAAAALIPGFRSRGARPEPTEAQALSQGCRTRIVAMRNSVSWYRGSRRVVVESVDACSRRFPNLYELSGVTLSVQQGGRTLARVHSKNASLRMREGELFMEQPIARERGCIPSAELLKVNLKTGELRAPGLRMQLNSGSPIRCAEGPGYAG